MLKLMKDLPDNVIGVTGEGEITGSDYENILIPAVEEKLKNHEKVRFIYHMGKDLKDLMQKQCLMILCLNKTFYSMGKNSIRF
ncbi:MAG: STAS/SEC14 domain-containing protein [Ignavibacteria bacterium]